MDLRIAEVYFNKLTNASSELDLVDCQATDCKHTSPAATVTAGGGTGGNDTVT